MLDEYTFWDWVWFVIIWAVGCFVYAFVREAAIDLWHWYRARGKDKGGTG